MAIPTVIAYNRDTGPVQRTTGYVTLITAATDTYSANAISLAAGVLTLSLGYVPTHVMITNATTRIMTEWFAPLVPTTSIDTAAAGTRTLNTSSKMVVTGRTGTGGSSTQSGGTADTAASGTVVLTLSGFATDADTITWVAEG